MTKKEIVIGILIVLIVLGIGIKMRGAAMPAKKLNVQLVDSIFKPGGPLPVEYTCDGA